MNPESFKYSQNYTKDLIKLAFIFILDSKKKSTDNLAVIG